MYLSFHDIDTLHLIVYEIFLFQLSKAKWALLVLKCSIQLSGYVVTLITPLQTLFDTLPLFAYNSVLIVATDAMPIVVIVLMPGEREMTIFMAQQVVPES